jgi:1-acyl-sn-glycerol-3-phosphate acyltransferase
VIRALRFLFAVTVLTLWYGGRVFVNAWRGVRHQPGGVYDEICRNWGVKMMRWNRLHATVEGIERLVPGQPYVYVANHASFVDIWALLEHLPGSIRFVYKKELGGIPVFGAAVRASGHIAIDRQNRASAFSAYDVAAGDVRGGTSAMVFAEGTRSADGRLMTFKKGPFVLAIAAGVPVVPVAVLGAYESLPKGSIAPRQVPITIRIGTLIPSTGRSYEDRDAVSSQCRRELEALGVPPGQ